MECYIVNRMIIDTPWLLGKKHIKVIDTYEAEIVGVKEGYYMIEFRDSSMQVVEALVPKVEFSHHIMHPVKVCEGYNFHIVIYQVICNKNLIVGSWPIVKYWNIDLKE